LAGSGSERRGKLTEAAAAMAGGGRRTHTQEEREAAFYSRAHAEASLLRVRARGTVTLAVRARRADRRRRSECAHAAWHAGSPAETRPGGACGADACRAHVRTPRRGHGAAVHGGGAAATCGCARA
jgi:hypothetical protein